MTEILICPPLFVDIVPFSISVVFSSGLLCPFPMAAAWPVALIVKKLIVDAVGACIGFKADAKGLWPAIRG